VKEERELLGPHGACYSSEQWWNNRQQRAKQTLALFTAHKAKQSSYDNAASRNITNAQADQCYNLQQKAVVELVVDGFFEDVETFVKQQMLNKYRQQQCMLFITQQRTEYAHTASWNKSSYALCNGTISQKNINGKNWPVYNQLQGRHSRSSKTAKITLVGLRLER